jgi:D-glycero-D-manno-heptose 1,7-bisphosphate phosphatase
MGDKAVYVDLDGTIRTTLSGKVAPSDPHDQVVLPGRKERLQSLKKQGYKIFAVSNQGGIEKGHVTHDQVKACFAKLDHDLGYVFDDMVYASSMDPKHPMRKPNPGMIHGLAEKHGVDLTKSFMVGDMASDRTAAERAGIPFHHADDFFKE